MISISSNYNFNDKLVSSKFYNPDKYDYSLIDYKRTNIKVIIIDKEYDSKHLITPYKLLNGVSCSIQNCIDKEELLKSKFLLVHGDRYEYNFTYNGYHKKISIICKLHGEFKQAINSHLKGHGCSICGGSNRSNLNDILKSFRGIHGDLYNYSKVEYINMRTKVVIICNKCSNVFDQVPYSHLKGDGCSNCSGNMKLTTEEIIKHFIEVNGDLYNYDKVEYSGAHKDVIITCEKHGDFKMSPNNHRRMKGCYKCKMSKGEKIIMNYLKTNNINFISQYKFNECRYKNPLPFDFYLTDLNICIEYNGIQHYEVNEFFGGEDGYKQRVRNDNIKIYYCHNNKVKLVTIKYDSDIQEELLLKL